MNIKSRHNSSITISIRRLWKEILISVILLLWSNSVFAWGATGHRLIGQAAVAALPDEIPAFLREGAAVQAVGELAREPDRWKGSGKTHDSDRDGAHFLDLGDDGHVLAGPTLATLPATREEYDAQMRAAGADSWKAGWLPYAIVDGWQQLAKDFAYWRVDDWAAQNVPDPDHRAWFAADRRARQALILSDLGDLAHYVGDGSQPLHLTSHFNGWGEGPNPEGFTQSRLHAMFEGAFVHDHVTLAQVTAAMGAPADCGCAIAVRVAGYLAATNAQVAPLYRLQKTGAFGADPHPGEVFATARLAAGAGELRDLVLMAWRASADEAVGWPAIKASDVASGAFDPYPSLYGAD